MESLSQSHVLASEGRHLASEPHLRIQVRRVPGTAHEQRRDLFGGYHGELLVICLKGQCRIETGSSGLDLAELDQALLVDGEPFRLLGTGVEDAMVEMIWAPGPNPCRTCWDADGKFFVGVAAR